MASFTPHQDTALKAVADWLAERVSERFVPVLGQVRTQVRVAANTLPWC